MCRFARIAILIVAAAAFCEGVRAQGAGTVAGTVTDETGGVLPGVNVHLEIYVGDSGSTEDGPGSRRVGIEITTYIYPHPWV